MTTGQRYVYRSHLWTRFNSRSTSSGPDLYSFLISKTCIQHLASCLLTKDMMIFQKININIAQQTHMLCRMQRAKSQTLLVCKFDESFQNYFKRHSSKLLTLKGRQRRQEFISYQEKKYKIVLMKKKRWEIVLTGKRICCTVMCHIMTFPSTQTAYMMVVP